MSAVDQIRDEYRRRQQVEALYAQVLELEQANRILREENEALCDVIAAFVREEIVIPMPIEVRH